MASLPSERVGKFHSRIEDDVVFYIPGADQSKANGLHLQLPSRAGSSREEKDQLRVYDKLAATRANYNNRVERQTANKTSTKRGSCRVHAAILNAKRCLTRCSA